jgi:hypothetical protein
MAGFKGDPPRQPPRWEAAQRSVEAALGAGEAALGAGEAERLSSSAYSLATRLG